MASFAEAVFGELFRESALQRERTSLRVKMTQGVFLTQIPLRRFDIVFMMQNNNCL